MIIQAKAYPRAALIGNPSDGYFGKTIAFTFSEFSANATLFESPELRIEPSARDGASYDSLDALAADIRLFGYYGGIRLIKAALKCFFDYTREHDIRLEKRNFTIRYSSNIPNLVGLAGSSAIISAAMRAILSFYGVEIPKPQLANLIRAAENVELGITAGLQDRVAQVYQGLVHMDFDRELLEKTGCGTYTPLDISLMPKNLFIAYRTDLSEGSEVFHNNIRDRFNAGDPAVTGAMKRWAALTDSARTALEEGNSAALAKLMDENFDLRASLYKLSEGNLKMVKLARSFGASAKFSGSGGAIIGIAPDASALDAMTEAFRPSGVRVIRPTIV